MYIVGGIEKEMALFVRTRSAFGEWRMITMQLLTHDDTDTLVTVCAHPFEYFTSYLQPTKRSEYFCFLPTTNKYANFFI